MNNNTRLERKIELNEMATKFLFVMLTLCALAVMIMALNLTKITQQKKPELEFQAFEMVENNQR